MSLKQQLEEILPSLLPKREEDAIKGTELIARVRAILGDSYSDRSLRSQFSFIALEEDSCLARVPNGQGYYLRPSGESTSLHNIFEDGASGNSPLHKALALAVRLYDTAGMGVFVYPVEEEESWLHPDLVAVHWPAGTWGEDGVYLVENKAETQEAIYRAVCVGFNDGAESCRKAFFRALSCGNWAQETELILLPGESDEAADAGELQSLAAQFGVGICLLDADLQQIPRADTLYRAESTEARTILARIPNVDLATPRNKCLRSPLPDDISVVVQWVQHCINKGRIESFEQRVAIN
ncbi:MAG: hypothetical protein IJ985_05495 [Akkermansia sp.]|nr:hypothetical protein [Akkermansia sp.]